MIGQIQEGVNILAQMIGLTFDLASEEIEKREAAQQQALQLLERYKKILPLDVRLKQADEELQKERDAERARRAAAEVKPVIDPAALAALPEELRARVEAHLRLPMIAPAVPAIGETSG